MHISENHSQLGIPSSYFAQILALKVLTNYPLQIEKDISFIDITSFGHFLLKNYLKIEKRSEI